MYRYIILLATPGHAGSGRTFQDLKSRIPVTFSRENKSIFETANISLATIGPPTAAEIHPLQNGHGVVFGRLFQKGCESFESRHGSTFNRHESELIASSGGRRLLERYWGTYVAVVCQSQPTRQHVFADPIGNIPCYHSRYQEVDVFFSHVEDCVRLTSRPFSINRRFLSRWLVYSAEADFDCGLDGVQKVTAGNCLTVSGRGISRHTLWDSVRIASETRLEPTDIAARELRAVVRHAVEAWASPYEHIGLKLSGGFDSSVLAGCLANYAGKPKITCVNFVIDTGVQDEALHLPGVEPRVAERLRATAADGDERHFARLVAQRWELPMVERQRANTMDLRRLWHVPLRTSPAQYFAAMDIDDAEADLVRRLGIEAYFSGQGGDEVFLASNEPWPAIDYARQHGLAGRFWTHLAATCRLSKESMWSVLAKAIRHGVMNTPYKPSFDVMSLPTLLADEVFAQIRTEDIDGSVASRAIAAGLPAGKVAQLKALANSQFYEFIFASEELVDHVDPLNSQPVWEFVLSTPTYDLLNNGVSRGLARKAFRDLLPEQIRRRQSKGTGTPFYQHVVRQNLMLMREQLLDGHLVRDGYVSRTKLEHCLSAPEPFVIFPASSLLLYLAAEIWLDQWNASRRDLTRRLSATV